MTRKLTSILMVLGMAGGTLFQANGCNIAITPIESEEGEATSSVVPASSPEVSGWGQYPGVWTTTYMTGVWGGY